MPATYRWGILGTGSIAKILASALGASKRNTLAAVASRDEARAAGFAQWAGEALSANTSRIRCHGSYDALLADPDVDVVYVATPHPSHAELAIRAAEAGKHVLCEKPIALTHADAMAIADAAARHNVFLMEAFMYRCHPQTEMLAALATDGTIGEPVMIEASFGFPAGPDPESRLRSNALGGGGIMDVGLYPVSLARRIAGAIGESHTAEPVDIAAAGTLSDTGIDGATAAVLRFSSGLVANLSTSFEAMLPNTATIFGTRGSIHVPEPWRPSWPDGRPSKLRIRYESGTEEEHAIEVPAELYVLEVDHVAACLDEGRTQSPRMSWDDTLGNMKVLDEWRRQIGLSYPADREEGRPATVAGRPLAPKPPEQSTTIIGGKPVSRLVMGCDNQTTYSHAAVMFDAFLEAGGNCFDTAFIYGGGQMEKLLGRWLRQRGVREDVVIIAKGAHTPHCRPDAIAPELDESLARLQTGYADIYCLHRDDTAIPVGEFITALNDEIARGRIRKIGASNWSLPRLREANAYAAEHGLAGFEVVSNNFSLARMENPVWPGVAAAGGAGFRDWLAETGIALFPWSSQARGFFTDRAHPDKLGDPELVNAWYSAENFARRARAYELAERKGTSPTTVALAYVLNQPFATHPLIGPRTLAELRSSWEALSLELTPADIAWLKTGT